MLQCFTHMGISKVSTFVIVVQRAAVFSSFSHDFGFIEQLFDRLSLSKVPYSTMYYTILSWFNLVSASLRGCVSSNYINKGRYSFPGVMIPSRNFFLAAFMFVLLFFKYFLVDLPGLIGRAYRLPLKIFQAPFLSQNYASL